ncbi:MAG: rubredoxin [Bacteroidales bacterium]|nr:rubredoxin [Bacteroidales bacterium]MCR4858628.1 rubredoxin [Bacteroidales bacterium]
MSAAPRRWWRRGNCGYVYDPAEHGGVAFEDLSEDWKCPRCRQGKEKFNKA